jgi:putative membrane protein
MDLLVVRASDMALARSSEPRVRAVATRLAEEHRGLAAQLSIAGRRLDTLPAARLAPRDEQLLATLDRAPRFDAAFVRAMTSAHLRSRQAHASFAARGSKARISPCSGNADHGTPLLSRPRRRP